MTASDVLPPHICEVQFSHIAMWNKRKQSLLFGHKQYKMSRALDTKLKETAFKIGGAKGQKLMGEYLEKTQDIQAAVQHSMFVQQTESKRNLWFYINKRMALRICSLYMISEFVIGTAFFSKEWTARFVPKPNPVFGIDGGYLMKARGVSYVVMGLANVCALNWFGVKGINRVLKTNAFCFGVWGVQNVYNAMAPQNMGKYTSDVLFDSAVCYLGGLYAFLASRK